MTRTREENAADLAREEWRRTTIKTLTAHVLADPEYARDIIEDHFDGKSDDELRIELEDLDDA